MDLNDYQIEAKKTAVYPQVGKNFIYTAIGLAAEAGEVLNIVHKLIRKEGFKQGDDILTIDDGIRNKLIDELGDIAWNLV